MNDYHKREGDYYLVSVKSPKKENFVWVDSEDVNSSPTFDNLEDAEFWMMTEGQIILFGYEK